MAGFTVSEDTDTDGRIALSKVLKTRHRRLKAVNTEEQQVFCKTIRTVCFVASREEIDRSCKYGPHAFIFRGRTKSLMQIVDAPSRVVIAIYQLHVAALPCVQSCHPRGDTAVPVPCKTPRRKLGVDSFMSEMSPTPQASCGFSHLQQAIGQALPYLAR